MSDTCSDTGACGIHDLPNRKLGKAPARHDMRTAHLFDFVKRSLLPTPPAELDWDQHLPDDTGMMRNDEYGDCGFAAMGHAEQTWTGARSLASEIKVSDDDVLAAYAGCTGFVAGDPSTDNGVVLLDALKYWRNTGVGGNKIGAFVKVDHHNLDHVRIAIELFGGLYIGAMLPVSAQDDGPWVGKKGHLRGDDEPGGWGGHCMWTPKYDGNGVGLRTWGKIKPTDWQWWLNYVDEAYAPLSKLWCDDAACAPNGLDIAKLNAYLASL